MDKCKVGAKCHFMVDGVNLEKKSVPVILSDESEVVRYNWKDGKYFLTLKHGDDNVDLSRKDILSLFINHNTYELPIGKFENVRLEDNKLKAVAVFDSDDEESMKIFKKLSKGFLQSFSVGINIKEKVLSKEVDGVKYYDVTSWSIDEASVVGIPAIPTAKTGLENETENETMGVNPASAQIEKTLKGNSMEYTKETFEAQQAENAEALKTANATAVADERKRVSGIMALGGNAEFTAKAIDDGSSVGDAAIALVKTQGAEMQKMKTNFESGAESLADGEEPESKDETMTAEQKAGKEADEALEQVGGE